MLKYIHIFANLKFKFRIVDLNLSSFKKSVIMKKMLDVEIEKVELSIFEKIK